jgi:hypothetical protein
MLDGSEPIDADELIYRRVMATSGYFDPHRKPSLSDKAFKPLRRDEDGISVTRAKYVDGPQAAAEAGYEGKDYYVIEMRAGDLQAIGLDILPNPLPGNPGHAVLPRLKIADEKSPAALDLMHKARLLEFRHHGPYPGKMPPPRN